MSNKPKCVRCGKSVKDKHTGRYGYYIHKECEKKDKIPPKKLSICPICKKRFYNYHIASKHAKDKKHYGDYSV